LGRQRNRAAETRAAPRRTRKAPPLPEGIVTFLLTDIEGSTPLWETHRSTMGAALARHEALVAESVAAYSGQLIKSRGEGDSTLSVFQRPTDAIAAALALQQAVRTEVWPDAVDLPTRVALHTGEAELRDGDYYGQTLNRAARLRSLAQGGQVLLSRTTTDLVADQLPPEARLVDVGKHQLKGLSRPEQVFALVHPRLASPLVLASAASEGTTRSVLVGRDTELTRLDGALNDVLGGQGQLVLVAGEAGIGKTRIAEELAARARARGVSVAWGRCFESAGAPAYWPWIQVLRAYAVTRSPDALKFELGRGAAELAQLVPEVAELLPGLQRPPTLDPETARFQLFDAVTSCLRRASRTAGLIVVLDDLHWADRASLLLLEFVTRELGASRMLLVSTYRDVEVTRRHPLSDTLAELARQPVTTRLVLRGLTRDAVAHYIAAIAGTEPAAELVATVYNKTDGNPFFVGEISRLLANDGRLTSAADLPALGVPEGVREVIGRRLNRLSDAANRLLAVASVQGRDFGVDIIAHAAGLTRPDAIRILQEPTEAHLVAHIDNQMGHYRFTHALVREVVYTGLSLPERMTLHHRVGEAIEANSQLDVQPRLAELAHHFLQSATLGDADKALEYAMRAGRQSLELFAYEEAADHFQRGLKALEYAQPVDLTRRCELLLALGKAEKAAGELATAHTTYEQAAAVAKIARAPESLAQAALGLGVEFVVGIVDDVEIKLLEEALAALGDGDSVLRARVLARLAKALLFTPLLERRAALSEQAVSMARRIGEPATLAAVLYDQHIALWGFANTEERLTIASEVVQLAESKEDRALALQARALRMGNLLELGDLVTLETEIDVYDRLTLELRQLQYRWHVPLLRSSQAAIAGRFEEAERLAHDGLLVGQRTRHQGAEIFYGAMIAIIRFGQGRFPEVLEGIQETVRRYPSLSAWHCGLAYALFEAGRDEEAQDEFEHLAADDFASLPRDHLWMTSMVMLALTSTAFRDAENAAKLYELLLPYARYNTRVSRIGKGSLGPIAHYLGLLAATIARWDDAAVHFDASIEMSAHMGAPVFLANSRYHCAQVLWARGATADHRRAEELQEQAASSARALGIHLHLEGRGPGGVQPQA
jgi:class 3 adenylate cyclase/tetratricopeptide (TPR) repeat protein